MQGSKQGRKGQLEIDAEIFEITPAFHVVEVKKKSGDTVEYMKFCDQGLKPSLKDIVWTWQGNEQQHVVENQENETQRSHIQVVKSVADVCVMQVACITILGWMQDTLCTELPFFLIM
ncbi:hypothetical protein FXO38_23185 [Capsicum annuum]|nr:hypothetical protein FXO37_27695 [Capsicum annuum]KAF3638581.1 hypothetical protein FXO38_23185 [Capsicum annuum]